MPSSARAAAPACRRAEALEVRYRAVAGVGEEAHSRQLHWCPWSKPMNVETCGLVAGLIVMARAIAELRDGVVARQHENGFKCGHNFAQTLYRLSIQISRTRQTRRGYKSQELGNIASVAPWPCYPATAFFLAQGRYLKTIPMCMPSLRPICPRGQRPASRTVDVSRFRVLLGGRRRPPPAAVRRPCGGCIHAVRSRGLLDEPLVVGETRQPHFVRQPRGTRRPGLHGPRCARLTSILGLSGTVEGRTRWCGQSYVVRRS
eukprot:scaffold32404_cov77-Phaeocystis_antarctica.AAC.1